MGAISFWGHLGRHGKVPDRSAPIPAFFLGLLALSVTISRALASFHLIPGCLHRLCTSVLFPLSIGPDPRHPLP
jgi:hypothetical protein